MCHASLLCASVGARQQCAVFSPRPPLLTQTLLPHTDNMADMDVDTPNETEPKARGKANDDSKGGKKRFEVKKVRTLIAMVVERSYSLSGC